MPTSLPDEMTHLEEEQLLGKAAAPPVPCNYIGLPQHVGQNGWEGAGTPEGMALRGTSTQQENPTNILQAGLT